MKRLFAVPLALIFTPQAVWYGFYRAMLLILDLEPKGVGADMLKVLYVLISAGLLAGFSASAWAWVFEGWESDSSALKKYQERQRVLLAKRDAELAALDAEIGIPRIPVRK